MADNFNATAGSGLVFAADDISSVLYQRVKVAHGADGSATDSSLAAPLPVGASHESSQVLVAGVAVTPKYAVISGATSGDNTVVAAVSGKKIRVLALKFVAAGTVNVRFESAAGGTALTGVESYVVNTGAVLNYNPVGWFETVSGELLNMELSAAVQVSGHLTYIEV